MIKTVDKDRDGKLILNSADVKMEAEILGCNVHLRKRKCLLQDAPIEVLHKLYEAMTWVDGDQRSRGHMVWACVSEAKELMAKAGMEIETLC